MCKRIAAITFGCLIAVAAATTQHIKPAAAAPDGTLGMALLSATVESNGTVARGAGVTGSSHDFTGIYRVTFNRDVSQCTYAASIGTPINGTASGRVDVQPSIANPDHTQLFIETLDTSGNATDLPFHVIVFCAR